MSTFRVNKDKDNPYVMLNKSFLNDINISLKAKGLLAYLLSLPDNWIIYENEIVKHSTDGKDSLKSAIKELMNSGYIVRGKRNRVEGKLKGYDYTVYETPVYIGNSYVEKSYVGKSANNNKLSLTNNNLKLNNESNNNGSFTNELVSFSTYVNNLSADKQTEYSESINSIEYFIHVREQRGFKECQYKSSTWENIIDDWLNVSDIDEKLTVDESYDIIDKFFETKFKDCDYSPAFYCSGKIKANRYYELRRNKGED